MLTNSPDIVSLLFRGILLQLYIIPFPDQFVELQLDEVAKVLSKSKMIAAMNTFWIFMLIHSFTIFCMYTPSDWTYKFIKKAVLSKHTTVIIMNKPMPSAISDKRRIPTLMPEMVDDVAIAVISQMMIPYKPLW